MAALTEKKKEKRTDVGTWHCLLARKEAGRGGGSWCPARGGRTDKPGCRAGARPLCGRRCGEANVGELLPLQTPLHPHLPSPMRWLSMPLTWLKIFSLVLSVLVSVSASTVQGVHKTSLLDMFFKFPYTEASSHFSYRRIKRNLRETDITDLDIKPVFHN